MSSRQYVIPTKRLTFTDESELRLRALSAGIVRAFSKNIGAWDVKELGGQPPEVEKQDSIVRNFLRNGGWPSSLDVRRWRNIDDAGTALDHWRTAALAAIDTEYSCLQAVAAAPAANRATKLVVFYKVNIDMNQLNVTRLIFRRTNATGIIMAQYDLEELGNQEIMEGYLSEPVIWDPNLPYAINALARVATGVFDRVIPGTFVFEPAGQTSA